MEYGIDDIEHYAIKGKYHVALQEIAESCYERQFRFSLFSFLFLHSNFCFRLRKRVRVASKRYSNMLRRRVSVSTEQ